MKLDINEAKEILKEHNYIIEKKNKYNFYPKCVKNISMKEGLKICAEKYKDVLEFLKDK